MQHSHAQLGSHLGIVGVRLLAALTDADQYAVELEDPDDGTTVYAVSGDGLAIRFSGEDRAEQVRTLIGKTNPSARVVPYSQVPARFRRG